MVPILHIMCGSFAKLRWPVLRGSIPWLDSFLSPLPRGEALLPMFYIHILLTYESQISPLLDHPHTRVLFQTVSSSSARLGGEGESYAEFM